MTATIPVPGLVDGLSNHEYHAHDSLSASGLCNCDDCRTQPTEENER